MSFVVKDSLQDMAFGLESIKFQKGLFKLIYPIFDIGVGSHI